MATNPEELLSKTLFAASNVIVACDMSITNALKQKYSVVFNEKAEDKDFKELLIKLKTKLKVPYEKNIRKVRAMRNKFIHEYKQVKPKNVLFALKTAEKFIKNF